MPRCSDWEKCTCNANSRHHQLAGHEENGNIRLRSTSIVFHPDSKPDQDQKEDEIKVLDAGDIQLLKTYGQGPYAQALKKIDKEIEDIKKRVNEKMGVKESETGLAPPNLVSAVIISTPCWSLSPGTPRPSPPRLLGGSPVRAVRSLSEK